MKNILKNKPKRDVVAQLTSLKEWSQNPEAYAKKLEERKKNDLVPKKIKSTEPVKIDFDLPPTLTAGLWSNVKDSALYKLLDNPKVMGVELGHEGIMEAINLLQRSGLLKKGGRVR